MKYAKRSITPSILLICFGLLLPLAAPGNAQQTTQAAQQPEARPNVQMLPPELRERGQALLNQKDELKLRHLDARASRSTITKLMLRSWGY